MRHKLFIEEIKDNNLNSEKNTEMIDQAIEQVKIRNCASCNFRMPCKESFEQHMLEHTESFKCENCDQNISTRKDLK